MSKLQSDYFSAKVLSPIVASSHLRETTAKFKFTTAGAIGDVIEICSLPSQSRYIGRLSTVALYFYSMSIHNIFILLIRF